MWLTLAAIGAAFFWIGADYIHLPGYHSSRVLNAVDIAIHKPIILSLFGWIALAFGTVAAWSAWRATRQRARLLDRQRGLHDLRSMSWQQFEVLVGECFRRRGYRIRETGQGGADGGVDLMLYKDQTKVIVQCKQWRKTSVGVSVVREMFGLMTHHRVDAAMIVCCGKFTREAISFATGKPIELVGGKKLLELVREVQPTKH